MNGKLLLVGLIVASICVSLNLAEVSVGTYEDPSHPGQCVVQELVLSPGSVVRHPEKCAKISCHENSKASIVTCAAMVPPPNCTLGNPVDPEANYPNCCRKRIKCKNGISFNS